MIVKDGFEAAVLISICKATKTSKSAHVPERSFARRIPNEGRLVKKALRELIREGYVSMHPTRGEMTYELTNEGLAFCREMARRPR
jgi:Mn-dependent DtxR family transcriptional regulator